MFKSSLLLAVWWPAAAVAAPLSADDAVRAALIRDPALIVAEARVTEAEGERAASRFLRHNPEIDARLATDRDAYEAEVSQPLSLTGEGALAARSARSALASAEAAARRARLETAADTRRRYVDAVVAVEQARLAEQAWRLAGGLREATERRFEAGEASLLDARLARLEEAKAAADYLAALDARGEALTALAERVGEPPDAMELAADPLAAVPSLPADGATPAVRSDVLAAQEAVEAARLAAAREAAASLPPVTLGAWIEGDHGELHAGPAIGVELPLWKRNPDGRAEAVAARAVADAELAEATTRADAEQRLSTTRVEQANAVVAGLGADLPGEAAVALDEIATGYRAGELDLLETVLLRVQVVDGQRAALEVRARAADAGIDWLLARDSDALLPTDPR